MLFITKEDLRQSPRLNEERELHRNSIAPARPPAEKQQSPSTDHPENYPVLLSSRLHGCEVMVNWQGSDRIYTLHPLGERASRLAPGALVYVRISRALPSHAEVYEPGVAGHRFLGHALFTGRSI